MTTEFFTSIKKKHGAYPGAVESTAIFDYNEKYRFLLIRRFATHGPLIHFCMLNPATADELKDDPTIRACQSRAKLLGYTGMYFTNIFAIRGGDPKILTNDPDPIGQANSQWIQHAVKACEKTVVAWGTMGAIRDRGMAVLSWIPKPIYCLGITKDGFPRHPLYVRLEESLKEYAKGWHPIGKGYLDMLRRIAAMPDFDDANLSTPDKMRARSLYDLGLIEGYPVEGSDAPVDALELTELGKDRLRKENIVCQHSPVPGGM